MLITTNSITTERENVRINKRIILDLHGVIADWGKVVLF